MQIATIRGSKPAGAWTSSSLSVTGGEIYLSIGGRNFTLPLDERRIESAQVKPSPDPWVVEIHCSPLADLCSGRRGL